MRVAPKRRRRWNNVLILAVVLFIGVLNLPTIIKTYLLEPSEPVLPTLLNTKLHLQAIHFAELSLENNQGQWKSDPAGSVAPDVLAERWKDLVGTEIDDKTFRSIEAILHNPQTVEVWYTDQEEPQRITFYQTPKFWLFKNWQDKWIAISVEKGYLLPEK